LTPEFDTGIAPTELDRDHPTPLETPWGSMALYTVGERVLAAQAFCPHLEGPLFQGTISGDSITCPWHQWRFSLIDGKRLVVPAWLGTARSALLICDVDVGPRGTFVLSNPRRGSTPVAAREGDPR
jgi:nitrite reductase/ring-hydroxylating ferredoxin subunit